MRVALGIEYDGSPFSGWQNQHGQTSATIQTALEIALTQIADEPIHIHCAGRTDAGVHAYAQIIHFECSNPRPDKAWVLGTNTHLPASIRVHWARDVSDDFHARFSAQMRRYCYIIYNHDVPGALMHDRYLWYRYALDLEAMQRAAKTLVGEHDFSAFRASGCQARTSIRFVDMMQIKKHNHYITIDIRANAFLYHMVRNIVGTLLPIGAGEKPSDWMLEVMQTRDRKRAGITAPAKGLYLMEVDYPRVFNMPRLDMTTVWFADILRGRSDVLSTY